MGRTDRQTAGRTDRLEDRQTEFACFWCFVICQIPECLPELSQRSATFYVCCRCHSQTTNTDNVSHKQTIFNFRRNSQHAFRDDDDDVDDDVSKNRRQIKL